LIDEGALHGQPVFADGELELRYPTVCPRRSSMAAAVDIETVVINGRVE
jgi:hypothetical protein